MAAFLKLALLVTGVGSLLVWAMPDLIVIGFILLILPGLILSLMPTVFMYLAFFSVVWFGLRSSGEILATVAGLVVAGLVGVGVPTYFNLQTKLWLIEAEDRDLVPKEKIGPGGGSLFGLVVIERPKRILSWRDCDELCQLPLYNDVAAKVTIRSLEEESATRKEKNSGPKLYWIARENCMVDTELMRRLKEPKGTGWSGGEGA